MWVPSEIVSGDTVKWTSVFTEYAPTQYTLSWSIRGPHNLDVISQGNGDKFSTIITATQSLLLPPGQYFYQAHMTDSIGERITIKEDSFTVLPNLAAQTDEYDGRSETEKLYVSVTRAISQLVNDNVKSYRIKEREVTKQDLPELIKWRDRLKIELAREKHAQAGLSKRLYVRF